MAYLIDTESLSRQGDEKIYFNTFKFPCKTFALVCKCIMLPQETLRSLAKVLRLYCVSPRNFVLLTKCCVFSQKLMKRLFPPPHILKSQNFWEQLQKYCVASRNIASLAKLLRLHAKVPHSPKKLCNAHKNSMFPQ